MSKSTRHNVHLARLESDIKTLSLSYDISNEMIKNILLAAIFSATNLGANSTYQTAEM